MSKGPNDKRRIDDYNYANRYNVSMTENHNAKAKMLGDGNVSAGIRRALDICWEIEFGEKDANHN